MKRKPKRKPAESPSQLERMRFLRAVSGSEDGRLEMFGFLSIMHPELSDRKKRKLLSCIKKGHR